MDKTVDDSRKEIAKICERFGVKRLDALGDSTDCLREAGMRDIEFLVEFVDPDKSSAGGFGSPYFSLITALEDLFAGRYDHVLLIRDSEVCDPYLNREVERAREPLYAK